jgi:hypothetical protein
MLPPSKVMTIWLVAFVRTVASDLGLICMVVYLFTRHESVVVERDSMNPLFI